MRVKIGHTWYAVQRHIPIMIELTQQEREQIAAMSPGCTKYAQFHDDDPRSTEQMRNWMADKT